VHDICSDPRCGKASPGDEIVLFDKTTWVKKRVESVERRNIAYLAEVQAKAGVH